MSRTDDGFASIESYAAIGDSRTVALVANDGRIDWWPAVDPDRPPCFAALLDPQAGGYLAIEPTEVHQSRRHYLADTNIVETTFTTASGSAVVRDVIPFGQNGNLAWSELVRQIDGVRGSVRFRWTVRPGNRFKTVTPSITMDDSGPIITAGDELLAVRAFDVGEPLISDGAVTGEFATGPQSSGTLGIIATRDSPVFLAGRDEIDGHVTLSTERWRDWTASVRYHGPWADHVLRSALALKLLTSIQTGAILAAPTTSLPEQVGGKKNWDYRYMWVRDSSFTIDAFLSLGLHAEAQAAVEWLLGAVRSTAPEMKTLYRLSGDPPEPEIVVPLPGYRGSRPVRCGNAAADQLQLGNFGDLFDTISQYVVAGHRLDPRNGEMLATLADRCCAVWMLEDSGLWELDTRRHYTVSKMGCWAALDRATKLAAAGQLPADNAQRWADVAEEIRDWVDTNCWSQRNGAYAGYAGSDDLDAATLLAGRIGFDRGERLAGTIDAIRAELSEGPCVYRYTGARSEEGAFIACSFWLVNALALAGDFAAAKQLMDEVLELRNDVGLLAEQIDPSSRSHLGNFPQGLSHLALINAACAYDRETRKRLES